MKRRLIKIGTVNCQGLNRVEKLLHLRDRLRFQKVDISFLQETHLDNEKNLDSLIEHLSDYHVFSELSDSKARGVAILVKKSLDCKIGRIHYYSERIMSVEVIMKRKTVNFVNVYVPNLPDEQISFIEDLTLFISNLKNIILGGDFNFVEDNLLDRNNVKENLRTQLLRHQKLWIRFLRTMRLRECKLDREKFVDGCMTWSNGIQSSRLDRFYHEKDADLSISYSDNIYLSMSDHNMVIANLEYDEDHINKPYPKKDNGWKLNESVLDDEKVDEDIINLCSQIPALKLKYGRSWYESFIKDIIKLLKRHSRRLSDLKNDKIKFLFEKLSFMRSVHDAHGLDHVKHEISNYYNQKRKGIELRACEVKRNFLYQPSKILIEKEKSNVSRNEIDTYKTKQNKETDKLGVILNDIESFYRDLMGVERVDSSVFVGYEFKIKPIDPKNHRFLGEEITYEEADKVIRNMKSSAPGPNGLTIGFYKRYFHLFGRHFIEILNDHESPLTDTFNEIKIKLIPKNANKSKSIDDLRPISLTNLEYRIFTKILTDRLCLIGHEVIGEHQSCSIKGRRMSDNITLTRDLIHFANLRRKKLNLISVDQRKAFDSISHNYLFRLLDHLDMTDFMLSNIKRLYTHSYARIIVNKHQSNRFDIKSGIKQGCALSMILYVMAIEELLLRIELNPEIKGFNLNILKPMEIKSSAYADDIVGYVTDDISIEKYFESFYEWGKYSGASINRNKTKILTINGNYESSSYSVVNSVKILGIIFDKTGIAKENYVRMLSKLRDTFFVWNSVDIGLIERVVACKTFLLSKVWFLATFYYFNDSDIKSINSIIFRFLWSNRTELIKRNTLILPYENGGLEMFCLRAKLHTVILKQLIYSSRRVESKAYQLSVYFLKFFLKDVELKNFNIIPCCDDSERPLIYKMMIESLRKFTSLENERNFNLITTKYTSKAIYTRFREEYEVRPDHQSNNILIDWCDVYKRNVGKTLDVKLREMNYRVIYNALSLGFKFTEKMNNRCYLCKRYQEDQDHLFINCKVTMYWFSLIKEQFRERDISLGKLRVFYSYNLDKNDTLVMSVFKYTMWNLRNIARKGQSGLVIDLNSIFVNKFNYFKKIFFN